MKLRLISCALLALAACRGAAITPSPSVAAATTVTDANIAAIVLAANNADILYGSLAAAKSPREEVRKFAQITVRDHSSVNEAALALAGKLNLEPEQNTLSLDLRDNAEEKRGMLRELSGTEFDIAYLENEISYHTTLLETIDSVLLPSAMNEELRSLISAVRPAVASHLEHARQLRASLSK
jgi:putative membrane protein